MPAISCSAPGKIILCGEHAVVYGKPAIAIPVFNAKTKCTIIARPTANNDETIITAPNIALKCNLSCLIETHPIRATIMGVLDYLHLDHLPVCEIQIHSSLPTAAGMGSSASTSVAMIRALSTFLGHPLENEVVNQIAFEIEKIHHGSPSGIDNTVVTYEKPLFFQKGQAFELLNFKHPITFLIADSGIKSSTAKVVEEVRQHYMVDPQKFENLFEHVGQLSLSIKNALENGNLLEVGRFMVQNQFVLKEMGVSCPTLDHLVDTSMQNGAIGAKLSGGGQGGNIIALVELQEAERISEALKSAGAVNVLTSQVPAQGTANA